jgi:phenylalanyl-tRNA synthetase alpha chain
VMRQMGALPPAERPKLGEAVNRTKGAIEGQVEERLRFLAQVARQKDLDRVVDVTLPGRPVPRGRLHLLNQVRREMVEIFAELGFAVAEGPQVETEFNNFEALAMPAEHPARDMQDTLYLAAPVPPMSAGRPATLLRTHTSGMQIRYMEAHKPPVRIIAPGRVYRRDNFDATHTPMFTQVEGLVVDEGISLGDLKGTLNTFASQFFGREIRTRFRPSFFPYTEPSAELDVECQGCDGKGCGLCKQTGWIEILGCGMVHPAVFEAVGYDPAVQTGFAFGVGIERLALRLYGVDDIRMFYENDLRFLGQVPL